MENIVVCMEKSCRSPYEILARVRTTTISAACRLPFSLWDSETLKVNVEIGGDLCCRSPYEILVGTPGMPLVAPKLPFSLWDSHRFILTTLNRLQRCRSPYEILQDYQLSAKIARDTLPFSLWDSLSCPRSYLNSLDKLPFSLWDSKTRTASGEDIDYIELPFSLWDSEKKPIEFKDEYV